MRTLKLATGGRKLNTDILAGGGRRNALAERLPTLSPRALRHRDAAAKSKFFTDFMQKGFNWRKIKRLACHKRLVGAVNFVVIVLLVWQVLSIAMLKGDSNILRKLLNRKNSDDLPYPLNLARMATSPRAFVLSPGALGNASKHTQWPGYADVRPATFRNRYPSVRITGTGTFDGIFVISNSRCEQQWDIFQRLANNRSLSYLRWPQVDARQLSLSDPPMPLSRAVAEQVKGNNRAILSILKRQLAYLDAHRRIWSNVVESGKQRVLVMDDTLFPTARLLRSLPATMTNIDQESVARQRPWHFIFLRRQIEGVQINRNWQLRRKEEVWTMNPRYKHAVTVANVSHGVGSYVLSLDGAKFLLRHVTSYRVPLDVEIGLLQKELKRKFVALSACNNDDFSPFCPEMVQDISSAVLASAFDCVWRRVQEAQTADGFDTLVNNVPVPG